VSDLRIAKSEWGPIKPRHEIIGKSVEGRPIECLTFGEGADCIVLLATIHGNESAGTPLLDRLAVHVSHTPELIAGRRIILVPVTNPDGMARRIRHNVRGVDLNRNFPASNWRNASQHGDTALSEPESVALQKLLQSARPSYIVSLHEPYGCIDYDGPGEGLARAMAAACDLPVKKLGGRPGSLGSYAGESLGIPIVTVEFPEYVARWDGAAMWERYGKMLLAAIEYSPTTSQ
jgi:protein MpaA